MSNNQFNLTFETELNEGMRVTTLSPVFCSGDDQAHSFIVKALRNGKPVSLSGATVRGFFIRPDNVTITLEGNVNADGDAVVTLSDACYNKQGRFQLVIRATIDGVTSTLFCGIGGMLITSTDSFVDDGNIVSLDGLLDQIEAMEEATARANEAADRADPDAIVQMVLAELGASVIGTVDEDNNIILTGDLADGTYTFKYENADGTQTDIGTVEVSSTEDGGDDGTEDNGGEAGETTYTNLADATSSDWLDGYRLNTSLGFSAADYGNAVTNFIPCKAGDVVRVKGLNIAYYNSNNTGDVGRSYMRYFASDKTTNVHSLILADTTSVFVNSGDTWTFTVGEGLSGDTSTIAFIRPYGAYYDGYTKDNVIITVNEEIA